MQMRKLAAGILAVLTIPIVALLTATPASATYACQSGRFCVYQDAYGNGGYGMISTNIPDFSFYYFTNGTQMNDSISSAWNLYPGWVILYQHANYSGAEHWFGSNNWVHDFNTIGFNDVASSVHVW